MTVDTTGSPLEHLRALERGSNLGRVSDRVFVEVTQAIRDLRLPPGFALSESELATRLQVSRTPVREAIARLVEAGLVSVVPQVGTRVALIALADVREAQFVREHLECAAYDAASDQNRLDQRDFQEALRLQTIAQKDGDFDAFFAADELFHRSIFAAAGFPGAWDTVQRAKIQLDRVRRLASVPMSMEVLISEHRLILEGLTEGHALLGKATLRAHVRRAVESTPALCALHPELFTEHFSGSPTAIPRGVDS